MRFHVEQHYIITSLNQYIITRGHRSWSPHFPSPEKWAV